MGARGFGALAFEILEVGGIAAGTFHDGADAASGEASQLVEVECYGALDLTDNLQLPLSTLHDWRHVEVLDGVVQMCGRDEPLQVHNRRPDPHRAAFIVGQCDRVDVLGRPAVPVASLLGVGRIRTDGLVHPQKIRDRAFLFRHCHDSPSATVGELSRGDCPSDRSRRLTGSPISNYFSSRGETRE